MPTLLTPFESITNTSDLYPKKLNALKNPPAELWVKGPLPQEGIPTVGIVGTRQASEWGRKMAYSFAEKLSKEGIWIISGLARGIDAAAHHGAKGKTLAVMGSGLNHIYPAENKELADQISILTEYSPDTKPHSWNFPKRNRIVAALSDVLLVIEAPEKSGTLITASIMLELDKKCFVIPGPIDRENFMGSNRLLKEKKGEICLGVEEILAFFKKGAPDITPFKTIAKNTHPEELKILQLLEKEDLSFDQLTILTGHATNKMSVLLMGLVLKREIKEYAGRIYGKVANHR